MSDVDVLFRRLTCMGRKRVCGWDVQTERRFVPRALNALSATATLILILVMNPWSASIVTMK